MKKTFRFPTIAAICALTLLLASAGCSSFNRDWKKASATPLSANDVTGRWEGSWLSEVSGHHGRLRCLLTKLENGRYRARYKATYRKILRVSYAVDMRVEQQQGPAGSFNFQGETDLGWSGGGVYHYEGHATPTNFFATYKSKFDHGTFEMTRPRDAAH